MKSSMSHSQSPCCRISHIVCPISTTIELLLPWPHKILFHSLSMVVVIKIWPILSPTPSCPYRRLDCQLKWSYGQHCHRSWYTWISDWHRHNSTHQPNLTHWWWVLRCEFIGRFPKGMLPRSCRRRPDNQLDNPKQCLSRWYYLPM